MAVCCCSTVLPLCLLAQVLLLLLQAPCEQLYAPLEVSDMDSSPQIDDVDKGAHARELSNHTGIGVGLLSVKDSRSF